MLTELEKSPTSFFREAKLREKSPGQLKKLAKLRFLEYDRPDPDHKTYPCTLPCPRTCPMEVVEMEGQRWAICPRDSEIDPIPLPEARTDRYTLSLPAIINAIRDDNGLAGESYTITPRLHFLGARVIDDANTAFVFALFASMRTATAPVLSLTALLPPQYSQTVVVTPSLDLSRPPIYPRLRAASIYPVTLPAAFGQKNFNFSYLAALKKRPPSGLPALPPALTGPQLADKQRYGYKCDDRLHIPGTRPYKRSNTVFLNGEKVNLSDALFALLMRFVAELKKGEGGWIAPSVLAEEGFISDIEHRQRYSQLRERFEGKLREGDGNKFIESDRSNGYRLSTHPDFVTYNPERLREHPNPIILNLL